MDKKTEKSRHAWNSEDEIVVLKPGDEVHVPTIEELMGVLEDDSK